MWNLT